MSARATRQSIHQASHPQQRAGPSRRTLKRPGTTVRHLATRAPSDCSPERRRRTIPCSARRPASLPRRSKAAAAFMASEYGDGTTLVPGVRAMLGHIQWDEGARRGRRARVGAASPAPCVQPASGRRSCTGSAKRNRQLRRAQTHGVQSPHVRDSSTLTDSAKPSRSAGITRRQPESLPCSNKSMDDGNLSNDLPDWWPYPVQCGHGHPRSPGHVLVSMCGDGAAPIKASPGTPWSGARQSAAAQPGTAPGTARPARHPPATLVFPTRGPG